MIPPTPHTLTERLKKPLDALLWLWTALVVAFFAMGALNQWPGLNHDAAFYTTPIIRSAALGRWEFDSFVPGFIVYARTTFDMHGQLYQFIFARVLRCSSYRALIAWSEVVNVITYLAYLAIARRALKARHGAWAFTYASGVASAAALACIFLMGRPEHLLPLLMLLPFALRQWSATRRFARTSAYVSLGLAVSLSPIPGAICMLGVVTWIALRYSGRQMLLEIVRAGTISLAAALIVILSVAPVNPLQWALNAIGAGTTAGAVASQAALPLSAFKDMAGFDMPLWNVFALTTFAVLAVALARRRIWWLLALLAFVFVRYMGPFFLYTWLGFMPILVFALLHDESELLALPPSWRRTPQLLAAAFGLVSSAGLLRMVMLGILYATSGMSFDFTASKVRALESGLAPNERIAYMWRPRPSFVALSRPDKFLLTAETQLYHEPDEWLTKYEAQSGQRVVYVLVPQSNSSAYPPDSLVGGEYRLVETHWTSRRPHFLGLKLGGVWPGYQFALYRRLGK